MMMTFSPMRPCSLRRLTPIQEQNLDAVERLEAGSLLAIPGHCERTIAACYDKFNQPIFERVGVVMTVETDWLHPRTWSCPTQALSRYSLDPARKRGKIVQRGALEHIGASRQAFLPIGDVVGSRTIHFI